MEGGKKSSSSHGENGGKPWTHKEIKKLMKMREEGETYKDIGDKLGRSERACQQFGKNGHTNGHKNGNGKRVRWTPAEVEYLQLLIKQGKTEEEISKALKKSEKAIRNKIKRMRKKWTMEEKKLLVRMHENLPTIEIAKILHKNNDSVINEMNSLMESKEWEKLVKEVLEEDKLSEDEDSDDDTNEKLKL